MTAPPPDLAFKVRYLSSLASTLNSPWPLPLSEAISAPLSSTGVPMPDGNLGTAPVETHMAWVFFTPRGVLKLKKPVRFPFLDFSTLQAREFDCREELRLNERLAPGVYLGLLALRWDGERFSLTREESPASTLGPAAPIVDWLVLMRCLPRDRMLDQLLKLGSATPADIDGVVTVLCCFYRRADRVELPPETYLARLQAEQAANREVLLRPQFELNGCAAALEGFDRALARSAALLQQRAANGHIVDGHGDLRPEHVCLLSPPVVIDCLEFNAALRQVDPFDELAFLGLECRLAGADWVAPRLLMGCVAGLSESPPDGLMALYTVHRALLRARLVMAHLLAPEPRTPARWAPMARRYLACARQALLDFDRSAAAVPSAADSVSPVMVEG